MKTAMDSSIFFYSGTCYTLLLTVFALTRVIALSSATLLEA